MITQSYFILSCYKNDEIFIQFYHIGTNKQTDPKGLRKLLDINLNVFI